MKTVWLGTYGNMYDGIYGYDVFSSEEKTNKWLAEKEKKYGKIQMFFVAEEMEIK